MFHRAVFCLSAFDVKAAAVTAFQSYAPSGGLFSAATLVRDGTERLLCLSCRDTRLRFFFFFHSQSSPGVILSPQKDARLSIRHLRGAERSALLGSVCRFSLRAPAAVGRKAAVTVWSVSSHK